MKIFDKINHMKKHLPFIVFIIFYFILISYKLITKSLPFFDWDESLYIQTGKEMFANNYFLFPVWQGEIWLDKPPFVPFIYGLVAKMFFFVSAEISTKIFTLSVSVAVLTLAYKLYYKVFKETFLTTLAVMITAFTPIYIQRSQVLNQDIFLLVGWLGYILFYRHKYLGFAFLAIAVFSKSLVGFYPAVIMGGFFLYQLVFKQISQKEFFEEAKKITIHVGILLLWYVAMFFMFGQAFWYQHIIESHFKRVAASIESHFGQRTYYFDLVVEQFGKIPSIGMILGTLFLAFQFFTKRMKPLTLLYALALFPWFMFLNVTKTKIFWYLVPAVPQMALLAVTPLMALQKRKLIYFPVIAIAISLLLYTKVYKQQIHAEQYSSYSDHYYMATYAKDRCDKLLFLQSKGTRETYATLKSMDLIITTTHWWGSTPSMVYYFTKPVNFVYDLNEMTDKLQTLGKENCVMVTTEDMAVVKMTKLKEIKKQGDYHLFKN